MSAGETFSFLTPIIGSFWPGGLQVGASATAAVANYAAGGGTPPGTCTQRPPTPSFTWSTPDATAGQPILQVDAGASLSLADPCQNIGYNWSFEGISNANPPNPYDPNREGVTQSYQYATGGTYTVTLTASNAYDDSLPVSQVITLGTVDCETPTAIFTVSPAAIYDADGTTITNWTYYKNPAKPGTSFTFYGDGSAFMGDPACHPVWSWDLGDSTTPAPATSTVSGHTYNFSGNGAQTVQVTLTVTNDAGTDSETVALPLVQDQ